MLIFKFIDIYNKGTLCSSTGYKDKEKLILVLYVKITFLSLVVCFFFQFLFYMLNINAFDQMWRFILYLYYAFRTLGINNGHSQQCGKRTSQAQVFYTICQPHRTSRPRTCPFPHNTSYKHRILRLTKIQAGSYIYPCNSCISITKSKAQCTTPAVATY